ncbi:hypothetical protein WMY93_003931 [Mugilogobius chulae]|uniref:Anion exchange protein n=1 Tax=Mugilogobius chulae TaxID=88201 RepID=A0AAW0PZL2_9GOBI
MDSNYNIEEGSDMSYEDNDYALPSPLQMPSPVNIGVYDGERRGAEMENEDRMETVVIPFDSEAYLNMNTNATTRGDAQAYVELNELQGNSWQETARWVGFEENMNTATGKWSGSHVSYLTFKSLIQLRKTMSTGAFLFDLDASSLSTVAEKAVDELLNKNEIRAVDREALLRALLLRRSQMEAPVVTEGGAIQMQTFSVTQKRDNSDSMEASIVLSGVVDNLQKPVVAFVRLKDSAVMPSTLESSIPVRFVFVLVGPSNVGMDYSQCGRAMGALMADWVFCLEAFLAQTDKDVTDAIADFMDCSIVLPPTEIQDQKMLEPIINFQRKMLRDRLRPIDNRLTFGAGAEKAPEAPREDPLARTGYPFGGMIRDIKRRYRHYISDYVDGLNPQVLAAIIFIYFAALSPAITFGGLLAHGLDLCPRRDLLHHRGPTVLVIGFSGPLLLFEEAFYVIFKTHPLILNYDRLNDSAENPFHPIIHTHHEVGPDGNITVIEKEMERAYPNTALLSMCLMFGCFFIAYFYESSRTAPTFQDLYWFYNFIFYSVGRRLIGDFGVPIAIFFMIFVDINIEDAYTQSDREQTERKMIKGSGFHFDLLLLVVMGGVSSLFGVPWLSAATVRSVTHANALTVMSKGPKPEIEKVVEQRISGIAVALLVGVSIYMEPILKMIPMTALFGIFLYMGITSLSGVQMWDRMLLLITPKKYHPSDAYATRVSTLRMHLFTLIQVICLAVLWVVKMSDFSLALPFVLLLTIPLRMVMTGTLFTELEMKCLDADDAKVKFEEEPGEDVYYEAPLP